MTSAGGPTSTLLPKCRTMIRSATARSAWGMCSIQMIACAVLRLAISDTRSSTSRSLKAAAISSRSRGLLPAPLAPIMRMLSAAANANVLAPATAIAPNHLLRRATCRNGGGGRAGTKGSAELGEEVQLGRDGELRRGRVVPDQQLERE